MNQALCTLPCAPPTNPWVIQEAQEMKQARELKAAKEAREQMAKRAVQERAQRQQQYSHNLKDSLGLYYLEPDFVNEQPLQSWERESGAAEPDCYKSASTYSPGWLVPFL